MSQLLIKGGKCVNADGVFAADVLVDEGRIVALGRNLGNGAEHVIEAQGMLILPGGVDVHVHLPWPTGSVISADDFASGTLAAAFGGVTTLLDFVIPSNGESLDIALQRKLALAEACAWVDFGFHINLRDRIDEALSGVADMVHEGFPSFKVFLAYEGFQISDRDLLRVMRAVAAAGGVVSVHAEDGLLAEAATGELVAAGRTALANYPMSRPRLCEISAIQRVLAYARYVGTRVHIHHVTTAQGAALIGEARRDGLPASGETCPHYLLLDEQVYAHEPAAAAGCVCAPPIRALSDQAALWAALASDSLSVVATDHCPYTRAQKEANLGDFRQVPGGLPGVETRLPLLFDAGVVKGRLSLPRFVQVWASGPARLFGCYPQKGVIEVGSDADLVLIDPGARTKLQASGLHMNSDCLPYEGWEAQGRPMGTILRGRLIVEQGRLLPAQPTGTLIRRGFGLA